MTVIKPSYRSEDLIQMRNDAIGIFGEKQFRKYMRTTTLFRTFHFLFLAGAVSFALYFAWQYISPVGAVLLTGFCVCYLINVLISLIRCDEHILLPSFHRAEPGWPSLLEPKFQDAIRELASLETFLSYLDQYPRCVLKTDFWCFTASCRNNKTKKCFIPSGVFGGPVLIDNTLDCSYLDEAIETFLGGDDGQTGN